MAAVLSHSQYVKNNKTHDNPESYTFITTHNFVDGYQQNSSLDLVYFNFFRLIPDTLILNLIEVNGVIMGICR